MAASGSTDHFDRFDNADAAREFVDEREEAKQERQEELTELHGKAQEIFLNRIYDTFTVSKFGIDVEFYRPVDLTQTRFRDLDEYDREVVDQLKEGSHLILEHKQRELEMVKAQEEGQDMTIDEMVDRAFEDAALQRQVLAAFAADESMQDPDVWKSLFPQEDKIRELFTDFLTEGDGTKMMRQLQMLQSRQSGS